MKRVRTHFRQRRIEFYLGLWTLVFLGAAAMLALVGPNSTRKAAPGGALDLRGSAVEGRIRVDWNAGDQSVRAAQSGTLQVIDGGVQTSYPVDAQVLRSGSFDYIRRSDDVVLTLTLLRQGKPSRQGVVRTIAPVEPPDPVAQQAATPPSRPQQQRRSRRR